MCLLLTGFQTPPDAWQIVMLNRTVVVAYNTKGLSLSPWYPDALSQDRNPYSVMVVYRPDGEGSDFRYSVNDFEVDCRSRMITALREVVFERSGTRLRETPVPEEPRAINPGTPVGRVAEDVCQASHNILVPPQRYPSPQALIDFYSDALARGLVE